MTSIFLHTNDKRVKQSAARDQLNAALAKLAPLMKQAGVI